MNRLTATSLVYNHIRAVGPVSTSGIKRYIDEHSEGMDDTNLKFTISNLVIARRIEQYDDFPNTWVLA